MADIVTSDVYWKEGETGNQQFIIYDSDGVTLHNLTGHTYTFKFWTSGAAVNKGSGSLTITDAVNGVAQYAVQSGDTDTVNVDGYLGEILETDTGLKIKTFRVFVLPSAPV